jgi:carbon dioxide concentrating mechanism protein CcmL
MKLGTVIGRVTLSKAVESLEGGTFLLVSPLSRAQYAAGLDAPAAMGTEPSLVIYDNLGADVKQVVGYEEGREAAQPFEQPTPVDAINVVLVDEMFYRPWKG